MKGLSYSLINSVLALDPYGKKYGNESKGTKRKIVTKVGISQQEECVFARERERDRQRDAIDKRRLVVIVKGTRVFPITRSIQQPTGRSSPLKKKRRRKVIE